MTAAGSFDAIVIGAGHNGLAAAATLARKGRSVCVIERRDRVGGMVDAAELVPGVTVPRMAHLLYNLNTKVARELGLGRSIPMPLRPLATVSLAADGASVVIRDGAASLADGRPHPQAAAYATLHARLVRFAGILGRLSTRSPPGLEGGLTSLAALGDLSALAALGIDLKRLGKAEMREMLRILLSNVHDLLLDELGDGPLAGAMAADAVRGAYAGPRSPGTVFSLLYRLGNGGTPAWPVGGMGAVAEAFATAARAAGCEIRCGQGVARILVTEDRVRGVMLEDGTEIAARAVLSGAGPLETMRMAGPSQFDIEAVRRLRNLRAKGTVAKFNAVLGAMPVFTGLPPALHHERLLIAPSSAYVERAFNPAKYGEMPPAPTIELILPEAGGGRRALSAVVNFVPPAPEGGRTAEMRAEIGRTIQAILEAHAPGIGGLIEASELLLPEDISAETGAPGGHWHHAELGLDQILNTRPVNGMARYAMGPGGLFLCGASAHPGGDITGAPGRNSALQLLRDGGA